MTHMDRRREMEDLAGEAPVKRGPGRPRKVVTEPVVKRGPGRPKKVVAPEQTDEDDYDTPDMSFKTAHMANKGLPIRWYAHAFKLTEHNVKRRLTDVAPIDFGPHGNPLYAMTDAAPYLVETKTSVVELLRGIKDEDLPSDLSLKMWQVRKIKNKVLQEEGELWHSSTVMEKFSEVLLRIREKLQLIPDRVERMTGITPEQYKLIRGIVDAVQEEMYRAAMQMAENDNTPSALGEDDEEVVL